MRPFGVRDGAAKAAGLRLRRGQNPLSLFGCAEKRKRLLMVSREKTLAAAFRTSSGTLAAPDTGGLARWKPAGVAHSTTYGSCESRSPARMLCRSLFAAAPWHSRRSPEAPLPVFRNHRTAAAKEEQGAYLNSPSFRTCHTWLSGRKLSNQQPITPVQGGKRHFRRSLKCRRRAFFS